MTNKRIMKVVKIGTEWCGPCRTLDKQLENFTKCEVIKYDAEENENIADKYNIRNIPVTILLDDNDNEIKRWVGLFNIKEIDEEIEKIGTDA